MPGRYGFGRHLMAGLSEQIDLQLLASLGQVQGETMTPVPIIKDGIPGEGLRSLGGAAEGIHWRQSETSIEDACSCTGEIPGAKLGYR